MARFDIRYSFDDDHLDRYYPSLKIGEKLKEVLDHGDRPELTPHPKLPDNVVYSDVVFDVLRINREPWEAQVVDKPMDKEFRSF